MSTGVGTFAQTVHAEHGVELLQEDQPRVEAPGEQAAAPLLVRFVFSSPSIISRRHRRADGAEDDGQRHL